MLCLNLELEFVYFLLELLDLAGEFLDVEGISLALEFELLLADYCALLELQDLVLGDGETLLLLFTEDFHLLG